MHRAILDCTALLFSTFATLAVGQMHLYGATASQSSSDTTPSNAFDGNPNVGWNAGGNVPQWIQFDLGGLYALSDVKLLTEQTPSGYTSHAFTGLDINGNTIAQFGSLQGNTSDDQWLDFPISNQTPVRYLRIQTVQSPSWVAWREIQVYAAPTASVSLTNPSPSNKQAYDLGTYVQLTAIASASSGATPRVQYYSNGTLIGTAYSAPYLVSYQPTIGGLYSIAAVATDLTNNAQATSAPGSFAIEHLVPLISPGNMTSPTFVYNDPNVDPSQWPLVFQAWHLSQRNTPINAVAVPLSTDFSKVATIDTSNCPIVADSTDCVLTNFQTPTPFTSYQRGQVDSNPNVTSGFQQYGSDVGSFINTWQSGCVLHSGGPHSAYEFRPTAGLNQPGIAVFPIGGDPNTEFVMQGDFEVPELVTDSNPQGALRMQLSLFAQFTSMDNTKSFFVLSAVYDQVGPTPEAANSNAGLMTAPISAEKGVYQDLYAYNGLYQPQLHSGTFRSNLWTGMTTFRQYLSRAGFQAFLNQFYPGQGLDPGNFTLVDFGVLHEVLGCSSTLNGSTAYHARNVGAYRAQFY
jgi:F5/8 type C domain